MLDMFLWAGGEGCGTAPTKGINQPTTNDRDHRSNNKHHDSVHTCVAPVAGEQDLPALVCSHWKQNMSFSGMWSWSVVVAAALCGATRAGRAAHCVRVVGFDEME